MGRRFWVVWAGQLISAIGSTLTGFALLVQTYFETGEILWIAVMTLASALPSMAASPLMGVVDRFDRRKALIVADSAAALATLVLFVALGSLSLSPGLAVVAGVAFSFIGAFQHSAYAALVPALVDEADLDRANGLVQLAPAAATIVGPALAALLVATWGVRPVLVIDLITFAVAMITLIGTRVVAVPPAEVLDSGTEDSFSLRAAVRWVRSELPAIGYLLVVAAFANMFLGVFNVAVIAHAYDLGGEAGAGLPLTTGGLAMVITSLVVGALGLPARRMRTLGLAATAYGTLLVASVAWNNMVWFVAVTALAVGLIGVVQPAMTTTFQEHVPGSMHGRLFGLRAAVGQSGTPVGNVAALGLAAWSVPGAIAVSGWGLVAAGLFVLTTRVLDPIDRAPAKKPSG